MDTKKDYPCCVYGSPEMMFRRKEKAESQLHKSVEVVAAVIIKDGRVLATQRGTGTFKGWWEFPGGKVEKGETREEALARELREELDAVIVIDSYLTTVEHDYPDFSITMHGYLCRLPDGHFTLREHLDARWFLPGEFDTVQWLPADIEVLQTLKKYLSTDR